MCWPRPVFCRCSSAARMFEYAYMPGGDVRDRRSRLGRLLLGAGDRHEARFALDQKVVRLLVAIGTVVAVAGDVAHDDAPACPRDSASYDRPRRAAAPGARFCTTTSASSRIRRFRIDLRFRVLDVQREALLRAVGPHEMRRQAAHALVVAAREVADAGPLDLDHARAEIGQLSRRERRRDRVLERDDGDAFEGSHRLFPHCDRPPSRPS